MGAGSSQQHLSRYRQHPDLGIGDSGYVEPGETVSERWNRVFGVPVDDTVGKHEMGWILSGGIPIPLKNYGVKVRWDDDIPNIWKIKNIFQTTNQCIYIYRA